MVSSCSWAHKKGFSKQRYPPSNCWWSFKLCKNIFCSLLGVAHTCFRSRSQLLTRVLFVCVTKSTSDLSALYRLSCTMSLTIRILQQRLAAHLRCKIPAKGGSRGGTIRVIAPSKIYKSDFFHHDFLQFGKQHSRYKAILPSTVLSQKCCEVYFISLTVVNP